MSTHMLTGVAASTGDAVFSWISGAADGDIDIDNDGIMPNTRALFDVTEELSRTTGKQQSMMAKYKVNYLRAELLNVDDIVDNDSASHFSGVVQYWSPNKHRIDAMQLARQLERATEMTQVDVDSFLLATDSAYSGIRYNWDDDAQVRWPTGETFAGLVGTQFDLEELFTIYGDMMDPAGPDQTNALWTARTGVKNTIGFDLGYWNYIRDVESLYAPQGQVWEQHFAEPIEVLAGLLCFNFTHSSTDAPTVVDDDYQVRVTVGVSGWEGF